MITGILPLILIVGAVLSLALWAWSEFKKGAGTNIPLGLVCIVLCCATTYFFTRMAGEVQRSYERNFTISIISKLRIPAQPDRARLVDEAVAAFMLRATDREAYLASLIRLNTALGEISHAEAGH